MSEKDGRRRRYVPVDVLVAFSPFGTRLHDKWGMEGLCTWMLFLAAAKREPAQGVFTFTSEVEAWTKLGAVATRFDFAAFITFCGRNKQTRKTRSGRVTYVEITGWKDWNDAWRTQQDSEQKSRKRATSKPTKRRNSGADAETEVEAEAEDEYEAEGAPARAAVQAEFGSLPISLEKVIELERVLKACRGADEGSMGVLRSEARDVTLAGIARVRESCERKRPVPGVGYAVAALRSEASAA